MLGLRLSLHLPPPEVTFSSPKTHPSLLSVSVFFLLVLVALKLQSVVTGELPVVTVVLPVVTGEFLVLTGYQPVVTTNHRISGNRRETLVGIKKTARRQKRGG